MKSQENVAVHVSFTVKGGKEAEAREVFAELVKNSRNDPGCLQYDMHVSVCDEQSYMLYERWESRELLKAHQSAPWMSEFGPKLEAVLAEPPVITDWKPL